MLLKQSFYNRPTLKVAQDLLGCFLIRKIGKKIIKAKIVETEAYVGPKDRASHASRGKTARNHVMFSEAGKIYVYFTYGMYYMLNIVTEEKGYPAAVLIRALEPMKKNSKFKNLNSKFKLSGPGKLTRELRIDKSFNGLPIYAKKHGLWAEASEEKTRPSQTIKTTRVGVDYAGPEWAGKKWRFYIKGNKYISKI